ncbi:hypothetical protein F7R15_05515 [Pseudomonas reinekei]|uniref:Uncharacterized protein n=1 Tax=Pseudomonas reinekei TaxID=395598 RepID=A0A6H9RFH5_PSERE|nr:hypothetical protein F7R15_05515 [Pseudomonas reinekei]
MGGKLQNFAKAAILASAQQNCSIDDVRCCPMVTDEVPARARSVHISGAVSFLQALLCKYL